MGKNIFSILSVFQGFLVAYFSVKLRFKIFIYPILIIFSVLNEPTMVGYWWENRQSLQNYFFSNIWYRNKNNFEDFVCFPSTPHHFRLIQSRKKWLKRGK